MVVDEREYHKACFRCSVCKRPITINSYISYNGELFCKAHKPPIDSKNPESLRIHGSYDSNAPPSTLKHTRNLTAPPLGFKTMHVKHDSETKVTMSENMCSLKNLFEKNDSPFSAPTTPQATTPQSAMFPLTPTSERIEQLKKEFQNNNNSTSESYKTPVPKPGSLKAKMGNPVNGEKVNKLFNEIDETWNAFEKSNNEYIKQYTKNVSASNDNKGKNNDQTSDDEMKEEFIKCEKELDDAMRNLESFINNYSEKKNESSSTESSIESFLDELTVDNSLKPTAKENSNIIVGINNIFKKNSEKGNSYNGYGSSNNTNITKSNVLWIKTPISFKYDKIGMNIKKQNIVHKKYITVNTLQDYINIIFEAKNEETKSVEDICKSIIQYNDELKHGCESSVSSSNPRPIIEVVASPIKFLIESLYSFYMKIRGIMHTTKLRKFITLMESLEDMLLKEGLQRQAESQSQTQNECSELIINTCDVLNNYSQIIVTKYNIIRGRMNVYIRDTFREEIISNDEDVTFSYTDCILDRVNADAKMYRNLFADQEHKNYVGNQACLGGPFIISIKKLKKNQSTDVKTEDAAYQAIVRMKDVHEIVVLIPSVTVRSQLKLRSSTSWKSILQAIHPEINVNNVCKVKEKDKNFMKRLMDLDEFQCVHKYKFGILYAKDEQTSEEEMFNNENGSPAFDEFLAILGDTVELKNYTGYAAGLDVQYGNTGNTTVVTKWRDYEITYHVSTMLPYDKDDKQQIQRKRHIGNDIVCYIFLDGKSKFDPATIVSQFLHVFIVVQPLQPEESLGIGYRVTVVTKTDVPVFGPSLPRSGIFHNTSSLRDFLLAKGINGENAAYLAPKFSKPQLRTRGALIEDLVKDYYEINSPINSSVSLSNMSNISQSPTNATLRSIDDNSSSKIERKSTYNSSVVAPAVTIVEEDDNEETADNNNALPIKKAASANNLNEETCDDDSKLQYDSCDSLTIKKQGSTKNLSVCKSQNSLSSDNADKKKSISSLFTSISNLGKTKQPHQAYPQNALK